MLGNDINITRIEHCLFEDERSAIIADFDADVGDFRIRRGTLRQCDDGRFFIGLGGGPKRRAGVTLPKNSETRDVLTDAVVRAYKESFR